MQVIQTRVARADFAKTLGKMREWLDHNDCRLMGFETADDGIGMITVKALFDGTIWPQPSVGLSKVLAASPKAHRATHRPPRPDNRPALPPP